MEYAALETDSMVQEENRNGSIPPINNPMFTLTEIKNFLGCEDKDVLYQKLKDKKLELERQCTCLLYTSRCV